ncbi:hypothetical protein BJ875DRAFT_622 [Amylocarpus encephaloides]|uniref:Uncharacterized protein n=1 Tax=Amylocarpus encephaloides TaxID=45428 RepID=A0A9P7YTS9_9HELO|nr:hypothetical protein BJ875DRAFT_622 [Amylocarpus encephaloides]
MPSTLFEVLSRRKRQSEFMRFMSELTSTPSCKHPVDIPRWEALRVFMGFPDWARTWIIREIALLREVMFGWGRSTFNMESFIPAVYLLQDRKPRSDFFEGCRGIMGILHILSRIDERGTTSMQLQTVLSYSSHSLANEPQDKIFGILGLCTNGKRLIPDPGYRKPLGQIFRELTI